MSGFAIPNPEDFEHFASGTYPHERPDPVEVYKSGLRAKVQKLHEMPYPHIFYGGEPTGWRVALNAVLILLDQEEP